MSRAWRLRAVDLFCVAAAALLLPSTPWGHPSAVGFALLLVAIGFSNAALIHVTIARQRVSFTLTEGLLAGAYLMAPGSWIIIPAVVGLIPLLVINKLGVPRRPEISANEFATSVECRLLGQIPFDAALFGTAANNGQMIAEVSASHKTAELFRQMAQVLTGRAEAKRGRPGLLGKLLKRAG